MRNVLTWNIAIEKGFEPKLYPYTAEHIPVGEFEAILDYKIWARKVMAICCYFTQTETGKKFQLTVYRQPASKTYTLNDGAINFAESPIGCHYNISVFINDKGRIVFEKAVLV